MLTFAKIKHPIRKSTISHTARIIAINNRTAKVRLEHNVDNSECVSCALSASCNPVRMHGGTIEANISDGLAGDDLIGCRVEIETPCTIRVKATVQLLVMPLVVFLAVAVTMHVLHVEDGLSSLAAIVAAALCYAIVNRFLGGNRPKWKIVKIWR